MENPNVLVDAKTEYTKSLCSILTPRIMEGIYSIFEESVKKSVESDDISQILLMFQRYLASIPQWSKNMVETEYDRIISVSKCDYIEDLITAVFVSHTKILTSIRSKSRSKKINLVIPNADDFIHKVYIQVARSFWKQPYIFLQSTKYSEKLDISKIAQQQNYRECEKLIEEAITETIRKMLPVKNILSTYLGESVQDLTNDDNEIENEVNHNLVKSLVEREVLKHNQEEVLGELRENIGNGENDFRKMMDKENTISNSINQGKEEDMDNLEELNKKEDENNDNNENNNDNNNDNDDNQTAEEGNTENNEESQQNINIEEMNLDLGFDFDENNVSLETNTPTNETPSEPQSEIPSEPSNETPDESVSETPSEPVDETAAETPSEPVNETPSETPTEPSNENISFSNETVFPELENRAKPFDEEDDEEPEFSVIGEDTINSGEITNLDNDIQDINADEMMVLE